ncbi:alpha/beta hydrolase-fold protein [Aquimarina litoralis]|uniref:alpha/beta hydrolase-fold protein n=1 Tax=Aquimarina litoralis TaxID=584605 RepID=UPI001C581042|nr:alpha/beta hydrolase-fold protein [Aquimarina litoralis]MBW1296307.1 esterase [Aquimarina litoralis]
MKRIYLLSIIIFQTVFTNIHAQEIRSNLLGEKHIFNSEILNEKREISIYLPENYQDTEIHYPVLYIIDGQRYFLNGILYQNTLKWQEKTPDFIVVGINSNNRKRRKLFFDESTKFIGFLESELIPYIDKNYRTSPKRYFFGWEMAGGLAVEILAKPENIFSAYFISSPTHITETRLNALKEKLITDSNPAEFIYFTVSPSEDWAFESIEKFKKVLTENLSDKVRWEYQLLKDENHHSTPTLTIHKGLNTYFNDYPYLRFKTLKDFAAYGGISRLKDHYQKRGEKYNISQDIHKSTKHFLLLQSMKEDDYKSFDFFMKEFEGYYKSKTRDLWFNRYAQFYLKHENPNQAIEILKVGLDKFQNSSIILGSLGDAFVKKGDKMKAKEYYKKALEFVSNNDHKNMEVYKSKLEQI